MDDRVRGWLGEVGEVHRNWYNLWLQSSPLTPERLQCWQPLPCLVSSSKWVIGSESLCIFVMSWQHISTPCSKGSPNQHGHAVSLLVTAPATMAVTKQNVKRWTDVCICVCVCFGWASTAPLTLRQHYSVSLQPWTRSEAGLLCSKSPLVPTAW